LFFVALESALFVPLLYLADSYAPGVIASAAQATLGGFLLMTAIVVSTRKDFSFLRVFLLWGGTFSLIAIVLSLLIGFQLGTWFSVGMILLAGGSVLYTTSSILREHEGDGDIAAAQQLFASIALMFWYVLQLFLSSRR
jgi:FtsH-binding integral membrane protein